MLSRLLDRLPSRKRLAAATEATNGLLEQIDQQNKTIEDVLGKHQALYDAFSKVVAQRDDAYRDIDKAIEAVNLLNDRQRQLEAIAKTAVEFYRFFGKCMALPGSPIFLNINAELAGGQLYLDGINERYAAMYAAFRGQDVPEFKIVASTPEGETHDFEHAPLGDRIH